MSHSLDTSLQILEKYFGYKSFRPQQSAIIESILAGKDTLVLMPTGGGKSVCFQIPAIQMEGIGIVVSPLIALMQDQVDGLKSNGIRAAFINSSQSAKEFREVESQIFSNQIDLLYVSPEKVASMDFLTMLKRMKVNLIAIDEAHCVSSWGHDFRPEYANLSFLKQQFPQIPIVALTATADKLTRKDIVQLLNMQQPAVFISSFDRPNIYMEVAPGQKRMQQIEAFINKRPNQSGIIYCLSRKSTETLALKLQAKGWNVGFYHAGMSAQQRSEVQEGFLNDNIPIICATIAFGMGIDKSNIRWVIHYNTPKNLEGYYQEIGRAGRDGTEAHALLFYSYADVSMLKDILLSNPSDNVDIQLAKLDRMQQFASGYICRRKVLLNYFSETQLEDCGHCDVCANPGQQFDGTVIAQKALSAIARCNQSVGQQLIVDILRGSSKKQIYEGGFHQIKTYGLGKEFSFEQWRSYLEQLIQQGFIEVAHDDSQKLKLTEASKQVLFNEYQVKLMQPTSIKERQEADKELASLRKKSGGVRDGLFEHLRQLRKQIATAEGVPPYRVLTDATLEALAEYRPVTETELSEIHGIGEAKLAKYGATLLQAIMEWAQKEGIPLLGRTQNMAARAIRPTINTPKSFERTYDAYLSGQSPEEIAAEIGLSVETIYAHLLRAYQEKKDFPIEHFVSRKEVEQVSDLLPKELDPPYLLKPIFEGLNGEVPYYKIRFIMAYIYQQIGYSVMNQ